MQKPGMKSFPASPEDAAIADNNLAKMLLQPQVRSKIIAATKQPPEQAAIKVGEIIGMAVFRIISSAKETKGGKIHIKLVIGLIKQAIGRVKKMMAVAKQRMPPEMEQQIGQVAGAIVEKMVKQSGMQGQQPMQQGPGQAAAQQQGPQEQGGPQGGLLSMGGM